MKWYKRNGEPYPNQDAPVGSIKWLEVHKQIEKDLANKHLKRVAFTRLPKGDYVSTVWRGLDHGFTFLESYTLPVIFESMVFRKAQGIEAYDQILDCERYCTEQEALEGHNRLVKKYRRKLLLSKG